MQSYEIGDKVWAWSSTDQEYIPTYIIDKYDNFYGETMYELEDLDEHLQVDRLKLFDMQQ